MSYPFQIRSAEQYRQDYQKSIDEPEAFWGTVAENFRWRKKWDKVLNWNFKEPKVEWFAGGIYGLGLLEVHPVPVTDKIIVAKSCNALRFL